MRNPVDHVLDALKAKRIALVELPEPAYREPHGYGYNNANKRLTEWGVFACTEDGVVYDQTDGVSPEDAWLVGTWWLAASRCITDRAAADGSTGGEAVPVDTADPVETRDN